MKLVITLLVLVGLAAAGDKPSAAEKLVLAQDRIEALQAENAKLRAVLVLAEQQINRYQARFYEAIAKASGCQAIDEAFNCTTGPVGPGPKTPPPEPPKEK